MVKYGDYGSFEEYGGSSEDYYSYPGDEAARGTQTGGTIFKPWVLILTGSVVATAAVAGAALRYRVSFLRADTMSCVSLTALTGLSRFYVRSM